MAENYYPCINCGKVILEENGRWFYRKFYCMGCFKKFNKKVDTARFK